MAYLASSTLSQAFLCHTNIKTSNFIVLVKLSSQSSKRKIQNKSLKMVTVTVLKHGFQDKANMGMKCLSTKPQEPTVRHQPTENLGINNNI